MNKKKIHKAILKLDKNYNIASFSSEHFSFLTELNIPCIPYSSLKEETRELSLKCSEYGFTFNRKIFYNDSMPEDEIIFTLAHELGHILLNHRNTMPEIEEEADYFAKCILSAKNK